MNQKDIDKIKQVRDSLDSPAVTESAARAIITNPAREAEKSLIGLLHHRTEKLQSSFDFEELIKTTIESRMTEASFTQLISLLEVVQANNSRAVEGLLAPLMASPAFAEGMASRSNREADTAATAVYEKTDDHRVLQGLVALNQLLDIIKNKQGANTVTAEVVSSHEQSGDNTS